MTVRDDIMPPTIAAALDKEMRQSAIGDNQSELSRVTYELFNYPEAGVSQVTISRILANVVVSPNDMTLRKLAAGIEARGGMPGVYERLKQARDGRLSMRNHTGLPDELYIAHRRANALGTEAYRQWLDLVLRLTLTLEAVYEEGYRATGELDAVIPPK